MKMVKKNGIVAAVSNGGMAFLLTDDENQWYNCHDPVELVKGQSVRFEHDVVKRGEKTFYNVADVEVVKEKKVVPISDRTYIDAGNCLRAAIDLCIANKTELHSTVQLVLREFDYAKNHMLGKNDGPVEPKEVGEEDVGVNKDGTM